MAISNNQLSIWANAPTSTKPKYTHEHVREAISLSENLKGKDYKIYLQGSYANSTNIKVDSDIDIVIQLNSTFNHDTSKLTLDQKELFNQAHKGATYHFVDFKVDIIQALESYFDQSRIKIGNKSIKLIGDNYLSNTDIVPCLQYRNYNSFDINNKNDYVEGIKFWTTNENKEIVNYPKIHESNGKYKNQVNRTNSKYKDVVRIVKNIKKKLIEDNVLNSKMAPSYFLECAIYNVPDSYFVYDYQMSLEQSLGFILNECDPSRMRTVSEQHLLFGPNEWQWNVNNAGIFFEKIRQYYINN